jgi:hypothetical protein
VRGGARHNIGAVENPFRFPPAQSRLAAANRAVFADDSHLADPLKPIIDYIFTKEMQNLYEELQALPSRTEHQRRVIARDHAAGEVKRFREEMDRLETRRRPGRPANDMFLCMIAVAQVKRCEREAPGASRDALFHEAAEALGGGIKKRQVRTAWCKVGHALGACPNAEAYEALVSLRRQAEAALSTAFGLPKPA